MGQAITVSGICRCSTSVPGLRVACPRDPRRLRAQLRAALAMPTPTALRYPKGTASQDIPATNQVNGLDILHRDRRGAHDVLMVAVGAMAQPCLEAAERLTMAVSA